MRNYILTEQERTILTRHLEEGMRIEGYAVLKNRIFKATPTLIRDLILLYRFYEHTKRIIPAETREELREFYEWAKKTIEMEPIIQGAK